MTNYLHARVCSLEPMGMPAYMRKSVSPAVILMMGFMMSDEQHCIRLPVTVSENRPRPGKYILQSMTYRAKGAISVGGGI